jgi:hypothetical protein
MSSAEPASPRSPRWPTVRPSCSPLTRDPQSTWSTPDGNLTGIELGPFAAFYRASWRANDLMGGRLDAAARVVQMLIDRDRARESARPTWALRRGAHHPRIAPGNIYAAVRDQRWLVFEALCPGCAIDGRSARVVGLSRKLEQRLRPELDGSCELTRIVCTRAAQYEVLRQELPWV